PPLGVRGPVRRRTTTIAMPSDALLLLYTDGLVERRTAALEHGLERLRSSVVTSSAESVVMALFAKLVGGEALDDDIAMLAVRRLGSAAVPARPLPETAAVDPAIP